MNRLVAVIAVVGVSACATPRLPVAPLGPHVAYVDGEPAHTLELGGRGELVIRPRLLATALSPHPAPPEDIRLQVVVRAIRSDGGVMEWAVGADGDAPRSEGGRRWRPELHRDLQGVALDGARLGPFPIDRISALEVLAGWTQGEPRLTARESGVRALGSTPKVGGAGHPFVATGREIASLGAAPLLAARVPLSSERARGVGTHKTRLVVLAAERGKDAPVLLRHAEVEDGASPWPVELEGQEVTLMVLDLEVRVSAGGP